jgi:hypothetical protein
MMMPLVMIVQTDREISTVVVLRFGIGMPKTFAKKSIWHEQTETGEVHSALVKK